MVHKAPIPLDLNTTGGTAAISEQVDMMDYGKVWFDDKSIANILALGNMTEKYRVTMDSAIKIDIIFDENLPIFRCRF